MPTTFRGNKLPTFPSTWYHPIYGARQVESYEDFQKLDNDWRETAGVADMDRTETEARVVMNHNEQVKRDMVLQAAEQGEPLGGAPPEGEQGEGQRHGQEPGREREGFRPGHLEEGRPSRSEFAFSRESPDEKNKAIVRNSVQAQESLDRGYPEPL
jgi:hypothetical protein